MTPTLPRRGATDRNRSLLGRTRALVPAAPLAALLLAAGAVLAGCGGDGGGQDRGLDQEEDANFDSAFLQERTDRICANLAEADVVFGGTVSDVGTPPGHWSGLFPARQQVEYSVAGEIKGTVGSSAAVGHLLVAGSRHASDDGPALSGDIFAAGGQLIVFARETDGQLLDFDAELGTIPGSDQNVAALSDQCPGG